MYACVELNIPIETDVDASYSAVSTGGRMKYGGKTFRSTGNLGMRLLYAYQTSMNYALAVTDKVFEGGTNAAVAESLEGLRNSGLGDGDIDRLSEFTANRRTFKDATWEATDKYGDGWCVLRRLNDNLKNTCNFPAILHLLPESGKLGFVRLHHEEKPHSVRDVPGWGSAGYLRVQRRGNRESLSERLIPQLQGRRWPNGHLLPCLFYTVSRVP